MHATPTVQNARLPLNAPFCAIVVRALLADTALKGEEAQFASLPTISLRRIA